MKHPACYRLYITHVYKDFQCDVYFPEFDKTVFKETRWETHLKQDIFASLIDACLQSLVSKWTACILP